MSRHWRTRREWKTYWTSENKLVAASIRTSEADFSIDAHVLPFALEDGEVLFVRELRLALDERLNELGPPAHLQPFAPFTESPWVVCSAMSDSTCFRRRPHTMAVVLDALEDKPSLPRFASFGHEVGRRWAEGIWPLVPPSIVLRSSSRCCQRSRMQKYTSAYWYSVKRNSGVVVAVITAVARSGRRAQSRISKYFGSHFAPTC